MGKFAVNYFGQQWANFIYFLRVWLTAFNFRQCLVGCFIFSPFLKLKKLGGAYDGILDTDFKSVIFIAL